MIRDTFFSQTRFMNLCRKEMIRELEVKSAPCRVDVWCHGGDNDMEWIFELSGQSG